MRGYSQQHRHPENYRTDATVIPTDAPRVSAKVRRTAAWSPVPSTWSQVGFDSLVYDRAAANYAGYGIINLGGACAYKVPVAGFYRIYSRIDLSSMTGARSQYLWVGIYKNGTGVSYGSYTIAISLGCFVVDTIACSLGDLLSIYVYDSEPGGGTDSGAVNTLAYATFDWMGFIA